MILLEPTLQMEWKFPEISTLYFPLRYGKRTQALHHIRTLGVFVFYHIQDVTRELCEEKRVWKNGERIQSMKD